MIITNNFYIYIVKESKLNNPLKIANYIICN